MNSVLFGLKLWSSNTNLIKDIDKLIELHTFHFIELSPIPGTAISPFQQISVPYVIHITPEKFGVNIADNNKYELNNQIFRECLKWADKLNAKYIVIHPGWSDLNNSVKFLEKFDDTRFLIENMPKVGIIGEKMVGYDLNQLQSLMGKKFGFCLDLNHAIKAAISLEIDYKEWVIQLLRLNPKLFHISDGILTIESDEHLNIGTGQYDMNFLMQCIEKSSEKMVTLETPRENNSLMSDVRNLKRINQILKINTSENE